METDFSKIERVMKRRKKYRIGVIGNTLGCKLKVRCSKTGCSGIDKLTRFPPCVDERSLYGNPLYHFGNILAHSDMRKIHKTYRFKNQNFKGHVIKKAIQNYASDCVRIPIRNH